jgi:conjugal transfer pilus assembly protein TraV
MKVRMKIKVKMKRIKSLDFKKLSQAISNRTANGVVSLGLLILTACSSASESFDSEATKGVGAKSISEVNVMIDQGKIDGLKSEVDQASVVAPVVVQTPVPIANPETIVLSGNSVIQRQPEQHMRIWFAPFQDINGNFHEASVVHTLLRPSFWQVNAVN